MPGLTLQQMVSGELGRFEFWFFDVRVFNPYATSNLDSSLEDTYRKHENDKIRQYDQRIREVDQTSFIPLVFFCHWWNG